MPRTKASAKNYLVTVKNEFVRVEKNMQLSVPDYKIVKLGISRIQQQSEYMENDWNMIRKLNYTIEDFCKVYGIKKRGYMTVLRNHIKHLQGFGLAIYTQKSEEYLSVFPRIYIDTDKQTIELEFNEHLKPLFCDFKSGGYFKIGYTEVFGMSSSYAISMYDFLKSYMNKRDKTVTCELYDLRKTFGIEHGQYKLFGHFKNKIIDVAKQQIRDNENAMFDFEYELIHEISYRKKGGKPKVTAIKFTILPRLEESLMAKPPLRPTSELLLPKISDTCPLCQQGTLRKKQNKTTKQYFLGCSRLRQGCKYSYTMPAEFDPAQNTQTEFIPVADERAIENDIKKTSAFGEELSDRVAKIRKQREKSENRQT